MAEKSRIQELIELSDGDEGRTCRSYSGRGMMGKQCLGVDVDNVFGFIANLIEDLGEQNCNVAFHQELADELREMQTDSMGKGKIVYFPALRFVPPEVEEEEENPESGGDRDR